MTPTKYFLARIGLAFGIQRRNLRMADAASETHLLRDAELHLGLALWEKCEKLEEVSVEYWNIRKSIKEIEVMQKRFEECQAKHDAAHQARAESLVTAAEADPEIAEQRDALIKKIDELAARRDQTIFEARRIRRVFDGLKTKLQVLLEPGSGAGETEVSECKQRMREVKAEFEALKAERASIGLKLDENDEQLQQLGVRINEANKKRRLGASKAFQLVGEYNQEVANLSAEIGLLQKRKLEMCAEIGRYLSRNANADADCAAIVKSHRGLIDIMAALRRSIAYNHRVAGY